jgi:hypothetical protein
MAAGETRASRRCIPVNSLFWPLLRLKLDLTQVCCDVEVATCSDSLNRGFGEPQDRAQGQPKQQRFLTIRISTFRARYLSAGFGALDASFWKRSRSCLSIVRPFTSLGKRMDGQKASTVCSRTGADTTAGKFSKRPRRACVSRKDQAINYAENRASFRSVRFGFSIQPAYSPTPLPFCGS